MLLKTIPVSELLDAAGTFLWGFGICLGINFAESSWLNYARAPLELLLGLGCQAELLESPGG